MGRSAPSLHRESLILTTTLQYFDHQAMPLLPLSCLYMYMYVCPCGYCKFYSVEYHLLYLRTCMYILTTWDASIYTFLRSRPSQQHHTCTYLQSSCAFNHTAAWLFIASPTKYSSHGANSIWYQHQTSPKLMTLVYSVSYLCLYKQCILVLLHTCKWCESSSLWNTVMWLHN